MYTTIERFRKCHSQFWALSNTHLFIVALATALSYTTSATSTEYKFSTQRCTEKQAAGGFKFGQASLCDASCEGTDDPEVGCSWSYPIDDPLNKKSDDAACRCNPEKYKWGTHVKNPKKCNNQCNLFDDDSVQCMNGWPFYLFKPTKDQRANMCRGPPIESLCLEEDSPDDTPDETPGNSPDLTPEEVEDLKE